MTAEGPGHLEITARDAPTRPDNIDDRAHATPSPACGRPRAGRSLRHPARVAWPQARACDTDEQRRAPGRALGIDSGHSRPVAKGEREPLARRIIGQRAVDEI